jgi:hypothetical protein
MNNFLVALKADLLDRRLLPFVALVAAGLIGAGAYTGLAGGGSATEPSPPPSVAQSGSGIALSAQSPFDKSAAETVSGSPEQRRGPARDPFSPLPGTATPAAKTASTTTSTSSPTSSASQSSAPSTSSGASAGSSSPSGSTSPTPATPNKTTSAKPHTEFSVAVLMGPATAGTPPQSASLTPYENLKLHQPLPSKEQRLVVFTGASNSGKNAVFKLVGKPITHGLARCLPSVSKCELIALKAGRTEELEYLPAGGTPVTYELQVTSIAPRPAHASAHAAARAARARTALASSAAGARAFASEGQLASAP